MLWFWWVCYCCNWLNFGFACLFFISFDSLFCAAVFMGLFVDYIVFDLLFDALFVLIYVLLRGLLVVFTFFGWFVLFWCVCGLVGWCLIVADLLVYVLCFWIYGCLCLCSGIECCCLSLVGLLVWLLCLDLDFLIDALGFWVCCLEVAFWFWLCWIPTVLWFGFPFHFACCRFVGLILVCSLVLCLGLFDICLFWFA